MPHLTSVHRIGTSSAEAATALSVFVLQSEKFSKPLTLDANEVEPPSGTHFDYHQKTHLQVERRDCRLGAAGGMRIGRSVVGGRPCSPHTRSRPCGGFTLDLRSPSGQNF